MTVDLRPAELADEPFLRLLYRSIREPELALTPWSDEQKAAFANQQFDLQDHWYRTHYQGARFLVVEQGGEPIGRLYLHKGPSEVRVMDIALVPASRGHGLGTSLVNDVIAQAQAEGLAVTLHVETFNPVRRLYARLGFRETSVDGINVAMRLDAKAISPG